MADKLLLQFAPLIYVAWSDGALTGEELAHIEARLASVRAGREINELVQHWLNPAEPPTPSELNNLLDMVRRAAKGREKKSWRSLAEFGRSLARNGDETEEHTTPELEALRAVEEALGVGAPEALNQILATPHEHFGVRVKPAFNAIKLAAFMAGNRQPVRKRVIPLLTSEECAIDPAAPYEQYRERTLECCRFLAHHGIGALAYGKEYGGEGDALGVIAAFETIAFHDLSLLVKFGVQFGLFGGSVLQLGTRRHHDQYLRAIGSLELPGCFAMTETGHGSNVRDIETTATYDAKTREFIVHTPNPQARKDYIGNAALHGRIATVFAQLEVKGERHGVHALLVPIRDESGRPAHGVRIEDCGLKAGLNGVDNGRIYFDKVRVPRENLLNRFADVSEDGVYSSSIPSASRRFFTMLGTLVAGRISIAAASCSVAKLSLTIATRYAAKRRQFGPEGGEEVPILGYQSIQRGLLPRIAATHALDAALYALMLRYANASEEDQREIEVLAASLKAYASWRALETVQYCREVCGGAGYLFENRFGTLREDTDIFTTFEGANPVLQQLAAKGLLTDYREQFGELRVWTVVKFMTSRASTAVAELNPIVTRRTDPEHLLDPEFHDAALRYREQKLLTTVARRLRSRLSDGGDAFDALNEVQDHLLTLARAHAENLLFDALRAKIKACNDAQLKMALDRICAVYALDCIERDRGFYLENGYIEAGKSKAIRRVLLEKCAELAPDALSYVDAFGIPEALVRSTL